MMNNTLFAQLITAISTLDDVQGAQLLTIAHGFASTSAPAQASTPTPAPAPKERKPLDPATDVTIELDVVKLPDGDKRKAFKLGYGAGRAGAKLLIKDAGFAWDQQVGAYVGTASAYTKLGIKGNGNKRTLSVSAEWVERGREQAQRKAERREAKRA